MTNPRRCPECSNLNTRIVNRDVYADEVEHVVICDDCTTVYMVTYGNPVIEVLS